MRGVLVRIAMVGLLGAFAVPGRVEAQSSLGQTSPAEHPPVVAAPAHPEHAKPAHGTPHHHRSTKKPAEAKPATASKAKPARHPESAGHPAAGAPPQPPAAAAPAPAAPVLAAPPVPAAPAAPEFTRGTVTGFPLPRFAALKSDKVNMRAGPGTRYQIDWLYQRPYLPVRIEREFDVWRLVVDSEGVKGWVHSANLTGRRSFEVIGVERALRSSASADASVVARLMPGVVGHILACDAGAAWCRVESGGYEGWLPRTDFWGTFPGEAVP